jgi:hypothetical protein
MTGGDMHSGGSRFGDPSRDPHPLFRDQPTGKEVIGIAVTNPSSFARRVVIAGMTMRFLISTWPIRQG